MRRPLFLMSLGFAARLVRSGSCLGIRWRWRLSALFWLPLLAASASADLPAEAESVLGRWAHKRSILELDIENGSLAGRVIALKKTHYKADDTHGEPGTPILDHSNPNPALRGRPMIGVNVFSDMVWRNGRWRGRVYEPDSGQTYYANLRLDDAGNLRLRGHVGIALIGKTATLPPVSLCADYIVAMLESTGLDDCRSGSSASP